MASKKHDPFRNGPGENAPKNAKDAWEQLQKYRREYLALFEESCRASALLKASLGIYSQVLKDEKII